MGQRLELRDGGSVFYEEAFLDRAAADELCALLRRNTPWQQEIGRGRPFPRLTAYYADPGVQYSYSGVTHQAARWTPALLDLKAKVELAAQENFNSLLLNLYRDGQDSIGFHADDEPELGRKPVIGSVSLGGVRRFILKHKKTKEKFAFDLAHGSLLVMGGASQHHWLHGVPKTTEAVGERVNLTFRRISVP